MYIIVGLGNPGVQYAGTRHNLGFEVIEELALRHNLNNFKQKHNSLLGEFALAGNKVMIARPQTFMNNSGQAVQSLIQRHKIPPQNLIVVYDDLDLEPGQLRLKEKGGSGGHQGVDSIIHSIGSADFIKVRIGIGRETDVTSYVLQKIPPTQRSILNQAVSLAAAAIEEIIKSGLTSAMNAYNG